MAACLQYRLGKIGPIRARHSSLTLPPLSQPVSTLNPRGAPGLFLSVYFPFFFCVYAWIITFYTTMASTSGEGDVQGHNLVVKTGRNPSEWKKNTAKRKLLLLFHLFKYSDITYININAFEVNNMFLLSLLLLSYFY